MGCKRFRKDFKTLQIPHPVSAPTETKLSSKWIVSPFLQVEIQVKINPGEAALY